MMIWSELTGNYKLMKKTFIKKTTSKLMLHNRSKRLLKGSALIKYKKQLKLQKFQREILVGTLLGDASMISSKTSSYSIKFEQKLMAAEYVDHLYEMFQEFVGTPPRVRNITGGGANDRQSIWFRTYKHPSFKFYYDIFYPKLNKDEQKRCKKSVPKIIHRLLTSRALAYWFMDDGTFSKLHKSYTFSTHGFDLSDQKILVNALKVNFGINASIHKDGSYYKLYIKSESKQIFVYLIRPFIHPYFNYKLGLDLF